MLETSIRLNRERQRGSLCSLSWLHVVVQFHYGQDYIDLYLKRMIFRNMKPLHLRGAAADMIAISSSKGHSLSSYYEY